MKKFNPAEADQARKDIGEIFRARRKELGFTIAELAQVTGIKRQSISRFENCLQNITVSNLLTLCRCLRIEAHFENVEDVNN